jgi:hypothetical protein
VLIEGADVYPDRMSRAVLVLTCLLAACSGRGVELVISGEGIARVEVFVAHELCSEPEDPCAPGVAWLSNMTEPPEGQILLLAEDERVDAAVVDGTATIVLQAEREFRQPIAIAIVGLDANDTPRAAATLLDRRIPRRSAERWMVKLEPADPIIGDGHDQPTTYLQRAHLWRNTPPDRAAREPEPTRCLVLQRWHEQRWRTAYFVLADDRDCDGFLPARGEECRPYWYEYNTAERDERACLTANGPDVAGACTLGTSRCADGDRPDDECRQRSSHVVCVPQALCATCDEPAPEGCVATAVEDDVVSRLRCDIPSYVEGGNCTNKSVGTFANGLTGCWGIALHAELPLDPPMATSETATYASSDGRAFVAVLHRSSCTIDFTPGSAPGVIADVEIRAFLQTTFTSGRSMIVPIEVRITPQATCDTSQPLPTCTYEPTPGENLLRCTEGS